MSITGKKREKELEWVSYIWYLVIFNNLTQALLDSESKFNTIYLELASQLGLKIWKTNLEAQKINNSILETDKIVVITFFTLDKDGRKRVFEESFLLAENKPDIMIEMSFITISNADVNFQARNL